MSIRKGQALKYTLLPGIFPRIFSFVKSGFPQLSYYIAFIYSMVRLLPQNHPYLQPENKGKYGIHHVIAQAADNLIFKKENADQILIFFTILFGLTLIFLQFFLFCIAIFAQHSAFADTFSLTAMFQNPNDVTGSLGPTQDIAFMLFDRVFGIKGMFESCISIAGQACHDNGGNDIPDTASMAFPFPLHNALHTMLEFYSMGILAIGALIIIYFVITIVSETAASGTPFGQRFNKPWTPIRIIVFFALLIPLHIGERSNGLSGGQLLTFWIAKNGSNFATNGWAFFTNDLTDTYLGEQANLIAQPTAPDVSQLIQFMLTMKTCAIAEGLQYGHEVKPYIVRSTPPSYASGAPAGSSASPDALELMTTDYDTAWKFSLKRGITIRYGVLGQDTDSDGIIDQYTNQMANVFPFCGDVSLPAISDIEVGAALITQKYYEMLQAMWMDTENFNKAKCLINTYYGTAGPHAGSSCNDLPNAAFAENQKNIYQTQIESAITQGIEEERTNGTMPQLLEKGWAGAAIWYNRVAEMNGAVTAATYNIPFPTRLPHVLEQTYRAKMGASEDLSGTKRFSRKRENGELIEFKDLRHVIHRPVYEAYIFWETIRDPTDETSGIPMFDMINKLLGTKGLFDMRENTDIHPLAQLTSLGKGMMEAAVRNFGIAALGAMSKGLIGLIDQFPAEIADTVSKFLFSMTTITIGMAAILYYVLPFLPFIYFTFAVSGWIKSVFEATVAIPLWALAHIRIDGDGIPGKDAANGYFLLFEIFIRPILILFGLIASLTVFAALVYVLNNIYDMLIGNIGGTGTDILTTDFTSISTYHNPIDEFFLTAMYAILCYMLGTSCFKMIDMIPNQILRWAGATVATFQENAGDPASAITGQVHKGSLLITNQIKGATQSDLAIIIK